MWRTKSCSSKSIVGMSKESTKVLRDITNMDEKLLGCRHVQYWWANACCLLPTLGFECPENSQQMPIGNSQCSGLGKCIGSQFPNSQNFWTIDIRALVRLSLEDVKEMIAGSFKLNETWLYCFNHRLLWCFSEVLVLLCHHACCKYQFCSHDDWALRFVPDIFQTKTKEPPKMVPIKITILCFFIFPTTRKFGIFELVVWDSNQGTLWYP